MDWKSLRIPVIIIAAIVTFGLIWFGQSFYHQHWVEKPLLQTISDVEGVIGVQVIEGGEGLHLEVTLGEVERLDNVFQEVQQRAAQLVGVDNYRITYQDNATDHLENVYDRIHFAVHEALAVGNYTDLATAVAAEAEVSSLKYHRVVVGQEHLYIQLHGEQGYLYQIIPRGTQKGG